MSTKGISKSGLFLMELILVILLFAISAAICLQMFTYASLTVQKAENLSDATLVARSGAECYQATTGDLTQVSSILGGTVEGDTLTVGYDNQWNSVSDHPQYEMTLTAEGSKADIAVVEIGESDPIYTLTVRVAGGDS